jgi:hypothetical protein
MLLLGSGEGKTFSRAGEREETEREGKEGGRGVTNQPPPSPQVKALVS